MPNSLQEVRLTAAQVKEMFLYVGEKVKESKPLLTKIDSAIGDGDHGIGMSVGFTKAEENLRQKEFATINDVFKTIGMSMISSMGGASGIIFGTLFVGGVKGIDPQEELNLPLLTKILEGSVTSIKERGKAKLGDKTMIDALEPAVLALKQSVEENQSLLEGLKSAEEKAEQGVERTKEFVAKFGRAKSLGERAIGYQDAGATTVSIIFRSMREWVEKAFVQE
ncbi:dihydroxyacetone kinase subunit L [Neobacillus drentensis]|uniref:dihydroxyacetone kinase subunit DhaL n=1 Tax=Neobacillus drentensis TaxID=220684 RepID=UPI001F228741|nr:dihydroxyacetone kinase subunit DhaL [Neobacillus drentensis]ULT56543.1 dihydroxyacetone kinase subunit L [Neobacillus drentensis]